MAGLALIIGRRGTGKSYLARKIALEAAAPGNKLVLVHDTVLDWAHWLPTPLEGLYLESRLPPGDMAQWALDSAPCTLIFDELDRAMPLHKPLPEPLEDIVRRGRHYGVSLIGCTQRPALVSTEVRALVTHAALFRVTSANDARWIAQNIDDEITHNQLKSLSPGHFLYWK